MSRASKAVVETLPLKYGATRQGDFVLVPHGHKTWPGMRGDQPFGWTAEGYVFKISEMNSAQKSALGIS